MDLYTTIVGLYSQNRHEVLRVVNTAIHSKCNLSEGIEVIHTGFIVLHIRGKNLNSYMIHNLRFCISKVLTVMGIIFLWEYYFKVSVYHISLIIRVR